MNVLVSNDDGIRAKGIHALTKALSGLEDVNVYVCAPDSQRSACGHGITMNGPIMVSGGKVEGAIMAWKTSGTPADCVKMAMHRLKSEYGIEVDVVFSGINHGGNVGTDVLYSGTVSAAIEALICGVSAVAVSINSHTPTDELLEGCAKIIQDVCMKAVPKMDKKTALNINFPNINKDEIKGLRVTQLGPRQYNEDFNMLTNPHGINYYWYTGEAVVYDDIPETLDVMAVQEGYVSVTPLHFDLTNYELCKDVESWELEF